ncbi:tyrosine-type recombinase/integrase [Candidatus Woesearchaeota archaeon]|nr:tyrosine-type recombinase/integrase [Candidatus Woesearchaeota archaeon]
MDKYIEEFKRQMKIGRKQPTTVYQYANDVKLFSSIAGKDCASCKSSDVDLFIEELIDRGYQNSSIVRKIASLKSFFVFLSAKGVVKVNPFASAPKLRVARKDLKVLTQAEVDKVLSCLGDYPNTLSGKQSDCIFNVMYFLGMRVFEVASLDVSSVTDSPEKIIRFTGKGGKERILPVVSDKLICSLDEWMDFRKRFSGDEALFLSRNLTRVSVRTIQRWIKKIGIDSGIGSDLTPHVLRRSFATHLLERGSDLLTVCDLLGHENISTTRLYAKVTQTKRKESLRLL